MREESDSDPGASARVRTAADRFRRSHERFLGVGLVLSAAVHAGLVLLSPKVSFQLPPLPTESLEVVDLPPLAEAPPEVSVPPPPAVILPPARPVVTEAPAEPTARPVFIPHDVPPRLENGQEVRGYLQRFYPPALRRLGVEGEVVLWLFVNEGGQVVRSIVQSPSGIEDFDRLARTVGPWMEFRPAFSQDRSIGVWVAQPIRFNVKRRGGEEATRVASTGDVEE